MQQEQACTRTVDLEGAILGHVPQFLVFGVN